MNDPKETVTKNKDLTPVIEIDSIVKRIEELEVCCTQLETTMENTVTLDILADQKTVKKRRANREWSEEEKAAFHARMVTAREAKEKIRQEAAKAEAKKK
jgi:hypothetical protein